MLVFPGAAGHAAQTAPRGVSVLLDWLHLVSGSLWLGGLIGLVVLWRSLPVARRVAGLVVCVPRFSNVAFVSVLVLLGTGIGATVLHLPVLAALWQTSYGKVILIKLAILAATLPLAAINLLRNKPGLLAATGNPTLGERPARLLRRLVGGEALLIARRRLRGGAALQPRPATAGIRRAGIGADPRRPWQGRRHRQAQRLHAAGTGRSQPRRGAELVRAQTQPQRPARPRRRHHARLRDARHANAPAGIPAHRDEPRHLHAHSTGARDGRPLGPHLHDHTQGRARLHRHRRRPRQRMIKTRTPSSRTELVLLAAIVALAAGAAAVIIAILELSQVLG